MVPPAENNIRFAYDAICGDHIRHRIYQLKMIPIEIIAMKTVHISSRNKVEKARIMNYKLIIESCIIDNYLNLKMHIV